MAQIGNILCTFVRGNPPAAKNRMNLWQVPGVAGYGAQIVGTDGAFGVVAVLFSNAAGIELWKTAIEALPGTIVTIVNDLGVSTPRCLVAKVSPLRVQAARAAGGITQRGEFTIEGVVT